MERLHAIAQAIAADGFSWWQDRAQILEFVDAADAYVQQQGVTGEANREAAVGYLVRFFHSVYDWDAPRMGDDTELMFWDYLVKWRVKA